MQVSDLDNPLKLFLASFKSPQTAKHYIFFLKKFCSEGPLKCDVNHLLSLSQRDAEDTLIQFIITNKEKGMSWGALHNYVSAVSRFYLINDINLNMVRVNRFMPEHVKVGKDRAYTDSEILRILELGNERSRALVLLLASTGVRVGAIPKMVVGDLEDKGAIYKVTVYPNTESEYFTYCTPECKAALKTYFEIRERHGEGVTKKSPVIREQYNKLKNRMVSYPRHLSKEAIIFILRELLERIGLRHSIEMTQRHEIKLAHGFRKFFTSQLVEADLKTELRWLLEGHNLKGTDPHYVRVNEKRLQEEYEKAIDYLTISNENRLKKRVEKLEIEKNQFEALSAEIEALKQKIK